jgi:hypothetical protein
MISSLVRWFERGAGSGAGSAQRFAPRLEALEDRAVPGGARGGVDMRDLSAALLGPEVGGPSHVSLLDSKPGGAGDGVSGATLFGGARAGVDM